MPTVGKYELLEEIGAGGMGKVYKARHTSLDRLAAVKIIRSEFARRDDVLARFRREASVCANLHHANVIKLYDYGKENGTLYYAMEYLDKADDLDDYLMTEGPMRLPLVLEAAEQLCSAFTHLHENGVVHRDVKPANIMISRNGHITLMDFGLVHKVEGTALTKEGKAIGTPRYMAPEQLMGEKADERTDIFQLGLVLYEMSTGERTFQGKDVYAIAHAVLKKAPPPPSAHRPELTPQFDEIILKCLHKKREDRFQSADELWQALKEMNKKPKRKAPAKGLKETAIHSKLSGSAFSSPDLEPPSQSRTILALASLLSIAFVFIIHSAFFGSTKQYSATSMHLRADMSALVVTWQSVSPYTSKIAICELDEHENPIGTENIFQTKEKGTTNHRLVISPLQGGKKYSVAVVYPNGKRSLARVGIPLKESELVLARWSTSYPSLTSHKILLETNLPCRCQVSFLRKGRTVDIVVSDKPTKRHELLLADIGEEEVLQALRIKLIGLSRQQVIPWGDVQGVFKFARKVTRELIEYNATPLLEAVKETIRTLPSRGRETVMNDVEQKLLAHETIWKGIESNRQLLKDIFNSPTMSVENVKGPLYDGLRKLEMVDELLNWQRLEQITNISAIYKPYIDLGRAKERPFAVHQSIVDLSLLDCNFLPINIDDTFLSITGNHRTGKDREIKTKVHLARFLVKASDRPKLVARVRNVSPEYYLQVMINGKLVIHLFNSRKSAPPTRWLTGYTVEMGETEAYLSSLNYIYAAIPKEILLAGENEENEFTVSFHSIPTVGSVHVMQLRELYLSY